MIVPLTTADDARLAPYRAVKERDLVRASGAFIVEGKVTLTRLVDASRFEIISLFLAESRVAPMMDLLARLDRQVPVYTAPQAVMDQITGFHIHRGVLALARRGREPDVASLLEARDGQSLTLLALIELANHDNVGACFRNAAALGADAVLLDQGSCDPLYRKSIRVSAGTALSLPFARSGRGSDLVEALQNANVACWALSPSGGEPLFDLSPPPRLAIVLGAEGPGLSAELIQRCRRVSIPMAAGIDSLNVATAGAIALAHVFARRRLGV
jgi:tRNA G18 (ribose-2'-O)-methylase SpoU